MAGILRCEGAGDLDAVTPEGAGKPLEPTSSGRTVGGTALIVVPAETAGESVVRAPAPGRPPDCRAPPQAVPAIASASASSAAARATLWAQAPPGSHDQRENEDDRQHSHHGRGS
jgi:hypothetical protein